MAGTGQASRPGWGSSCTRRSAGSGPVGDGQTRWEVAELVNALDPTIAPRLLVAHPAKGWCRSCRATAPCSLRRLATLAVASTPLAQADRAGVGRGRAEERGRVVLRGRLGGEVGVADPVGPEPPRRGT